MQVPLAFCYYIFFPLIWTVWDDDFLDFCCSIYFFQKSFITVFSWRGLKHQTRLESSYYGVNVNDKRHRCSLILSLSLDHPVR